ncbi:lipopolysaccharide/colanic/teichoic acid biosynthesis glycosyltransferase [Clostridium algidicarnis DSM 15099]|uniref:Lipopolysaccharide/colanic/teichoic acid biosynthesis glycosyltransferase n=1 Tax=Clostridium algidicarnis DSM 15099 TaxID=1121295 RepID=A0A2S6FUX0_9CLOT|nr:lipopolysaccharide/colanic/teichoic acid biosynthesis glycosyltransferase [Clostridium algidicarnis DSM 15099]
MYVNIFKRLFDIVFAIILMPIFLIVYMIVVVAIKVEDKGPVFYFGERLGRYGKSFKMYKFRSMKVNAPDWRLEDGSTFNGEEDPRQTKVGKILRKTSIDEIPQILNIIKGDMSFIGPRPDPTDWLERYLEEDKVLLNVLPGVTGYNQAYYRNSSDGRKKTDNDVYYAKNVSFIMDLKIFFVTLVSVLCRKNIYTPNLDIEKSKVNKKTYNLIK